MLDFENTNTAPLTLLGGLVVLVSTIKISVAAYQGFRLYVWSQFFCSTDSTRSYGQWAIVTGAANGIGRSMARELARRGHSIVAIDHDGPNLAQTKALLEGEPATAAGLVRTIKVDLSDTSLENYAQLERQLDLQNTEVGILINSAGLATKKFKRFGHHDVDEIIKTVNVNVLAAACMTRIVLPQMSARRKGLVLNISSILADLSVAYSGVYCATKAFISTLSQNIQVEYSTHQVDIVYLTPCAVRTGMLTGLGKGSPPQRLTVTPDYFARSALNALGAGIRVYSGCWAHGLSRASLSLLRELGLLALLYQIAFGGEKRAKSRK